MWNMFSRRFSRRTGRSVVMGAVSALLVGVGFVVGVAVTGLLFPSTLILPSSELQAAATDSNDKFVVATGMIDNGLEGVFLLDSLTGDLRCTVFSPRAAGFNALFKRNVTADLQLGQDKRPEFLLVTGQISLGRFQGISGQSGGCVAYVVEANSGRFAAYAVPWRGDLFSRGQPQAADLVMLHVGDVRAAAVRDQ